MASDDKKQPADLDETLENLAGTADEARDEQELAALEQLAQRVEEPGLQDRILERYASFGRELLSDTLPSHLDPRIAAKLQPVLGDVSSVRVHTGKAATEAARAMNARAFALGDSDIFIDEGEYAPQSAMGGALLAHEVAHTRDAATGFALSSRGASTGTSEREAFAHAVEESYIVSEETGAEEVVAPSATAVGEPKLDRLAIEERVMQILEERAKKSGLRQGR